MTCRYCARGRGGADPTENHEDDCAVQAVWAILHWYYDAPNDGVVLAQAIKMARAVVGIPSDSREIAVNRLRQEVLPFSEGG